MEARRKLHRWQQLDTSFEEPFASPEELAPGLAGRDVVFHVKTGLAQDDSQICVGFNVIWAALEAGADVTIVFGPGALLDLGGERSRLHATGVPLRLRRVIASQLNLALDDVPTGYSAYLDVLNDRGTRVFATTAMLIVTGDTSHVQRELPSFDYTEPAPYATVARLLADADSVITY